MERLPKQFTPHNKDYASKTICFFEEIVKRSIKISKIDFFEKLGVLFTKGLPCTNFEYLGNKLMVW